MSTKGRSVLAELAKTLGKPIRKINMRDPNVYKREQDDPARDAEALAFREAVQFQCDGLQAEIRGNGRYLILELKGAVNAGTWSINEPDQISLTRLVRDLSFCAPVFALEAALIPKAAEILGMANFEALMEELHFADRDSLNFYKNAVTYYARSSDASTFLNHAYSICHFVALIVRHRDSGSSHVNLPEAFADLNKSAREWAISDDAERTEALEGASSGTLRKLVDLVSPRLASINAYLASHSGEQASVLGSLAETVSEAQIRLGGKNSDG